MGSRSNSHGGINYFDSLTTKGNEVVIPGLKRPVPQEACGPPAKRPAPCEGRPPGQVSTPTGFTGIFPLPHRHHLLTIQDQLTYHIVQVTDAMAGHWHTPADPMSHGLQPQTPAWYQSPARGNSNNNALTRTERPPRPPALAQSAPEYINLDAEDEPSYSVPNHMYHFNPVTSNYTQGYREFLNDEMTGEHYRHSFSRPGAGIRNSPMTSMTSTSGTTGPPSILSRPGTQGSSSTNLTSIQSSQGAARSLHPGDPHDNRTTSCRPSRDPNQMSIPSQQSQLPPQAAQVVPALDSPPFPFILPPAPRTPEIQPETTEISLRSLSTMMSNLQQDITNMNRKLETVTGTLESFRNLLDILPILRPAIAPTTAEILALKRLRSAHPRSFAEVTPYPTILSMIRTQIGY